MDEIAAQLMTSMYSRSGVISTMPWGLADRTWTSCRWNVRISFRRYRYPERDTTPPQLQ
jgi:hypothetical protein